MDEHYIVRFYALPSAVDWTVDYASFADALAGAAQLLRAQYPQRVTATIFKQVDRGYYQWTPPVDPPGELEFVKVHV